MAASPRPETRPPDLAEWPSRVCIKLLTPQSLVLSCTEVGVGSVSARSKGSLAPRLKIDLCSLNAPWPNGDPTVAEELRRDVRFALTFKVGIGDR
jgi:hypothetical protein